MPGGGPGSTGTPSNSPASDAGTLALACHGQPGCTGGSGGAKATLRKGRFTPTTGDSRTFKHHIREGAMRLRKLKFGNVTGAEHGLDAWDSYDARYWKEDKINKGVIIATVPAAKAMKELVRHVDKPVPKVGATRHASGIWSSYVRWRFDCMGFAYLLRVYAFWRTMTPTDFNKHFRPLELGIYSENKLGWAAKYVIADKPGGRPILMVGKGKREREVKTTKTWAQLLSWAPTGTVITWTNSDAVDKINSWDPKREKREVSPFQAYQHENATKVGPDRYSAHPWGIVDEKTIMYNMAKAVCDYYRQRVTTEYVKKNIYTSTIRYPRRGA